MQFDWTTFALEALNFLVLVWLLKHFFYRPVLAIIEARQAATAKTIANAEAVRREADALKLEYQTHIANLDNERSAAKTRLNEELAADRARRLVALDTEINEERRRRDGLEARERSDLELALEKKAISIAARFSTRLLERLAGPELDAKLADIALSDLDALTPEELEALHTALCEAPENIEVVSAWPLGETRRSAFTRALSALAGREVAARFSEDPLLKAGVYIMAGSWVLMANLRDELNFFAGTFDHG